MLSWIRWIGRRSCRRSLVLAVVYFSDRRREPLPLVLLVFVLGGLGKGVTYYAELRASAWTGLDMSAQVAGNTGSLLFLFGFAAPMREAAKVAAMWPAFRSKHFDEPVDGLVYASSAALGFACIENAHHAARAPDRAGSGSRAPPSRSRRTSSSRACGATRSGA